MDIYDVTQITLIAGAGLVIARIGLALARRIETRSEAASTLNDMAEERLRALEEESALMRGELIELHERQNFTERMLQTMPDRLRSIGAGSPEGRAVTPH